MNVIFNRQKNLWSLFDDHQQVHHFYCDCVVRNELNKERKLGDPKEVVYTMQVNKYVTSKPYMPRRFPKGQWSITGILEKSEEERYLWPLFISTNARQLVEIWKLDKNGGYEKQTGKYQDDWGYGFHFWSGRTTIGCGRFGSEGDIRSACALLGNRLDIFGSVPLEVV